MAGGLQFDPPAQFFRKADTERISGSENGFLPRRSGLINGGTSLVGLLFRKRVFLWYGVLVLCIFSMPDVSNAVMRLVEGSSEISPVSVVQKADAIVVLSGMLHHVNGAPLGEWNDAVDRFEGGIDLFKAGKAPVIVFTRGQIPWRSNEIPEGDLLEKRALLLGVPQQAILLTEKVGNTADEAMAVRKLLGVNKGDRKSIILVTSAYHMRRAMMLFERAGFTVVPYRVDYQTDDKAPLTFLSYLSNGESLEKSEKAWREVIGLAFYWVRSFLKLD